MTFITLYTEKKLLEALLTILSQKLLVNLTDNYKEIANNTLNKM